MQIRMVHQRRQMRGYRDRHRIRCFAPDHVLHPERPRPMATDKVLIRRWRLAGVPPAPRANLRALVLTNKRTSHGWVPAHHYRQPALPNALLCPLRRFGCMLSECGVMNLAPIRIVAPVLVVTIIAVVPVV